MKILGIVFLYKPDEKQIIYKIDQYADKLMCLIIYNNTPNMNNEHYRMLFKNSSYFDKIIFMGGRGNDGLSIPINTAIKILLEKNYEYLLTMDQDSEWVNFEDFLNDIVDDDKPLCKIYRPNLYSVISNKKYIKTNNNLFNSGTLYGRDALKRIGFMNEDFFVEGADIEYGVRAELENISILTVVDAKMKHNLEEIDNFHAVIFGRNIPKCKYNKERLYGITFSNIVMAREFPRDVGRKFIKCLFKSYGLKTVIIPILLFERNKFSRLYYYFRGVMDGLTFHVKHYAK
jgi:rhamnosyltransferase